MFKAWIEAHLVFKEEEKYKIEDENSRLDIDEINHKLKSKVQDHEKCSNLKDEQKILLDEEMKELRKEHEKNWIII